MTTGTAIPTVTLTVSKEARRIIGLRAAFMMRLKGVVSSAYVAITGSTRTLVSKVAGFIPATFGALVVAAPLATKAGYQGALGLLRGAVRAVGWAAHKVASLAHSAINWVGDGIANLVGLVNQDAGEKVRAGVVSFSEARLVGYGWARQRVTGIAQAIYDGANSLFAFQWTSLTAGLVTLSIAAKMLVPTVFSTFAGLPVIGGLLGAFALGGWFPLTVIAGVAGVATLMAMLAQRSMDKKTPGIRERYDAEFAARGLTKWTADVNTRLEAYKKVEAEYHAERDAADAVREAEAAAAAAAAEEKVRKAEADEMKKKTSPVGTAKP